MEIRHRRDPAGQGGHCRRGCRAHSFSRLRPGNLYQRRDTQCKWRCGAVRVAQRSLLTIVLLLRATAASVLLVVLALAPILLWRAQARETMTPEHSAHKAKALLQHAITPLSGQPI